ncbi:MAG: 23S rRNA (adenine(2503)-C(2))-methyltransferase RlmN [Elusimicrobia bacterium]|nr:23S rRNA (adenine(2503)-C(2))-methyltransferase RlmN [Elusimicrobiota bacterium]
MPRSSLADLTLADLEALLARWGCNPANAVRIMRSFYRCRELPGSLPKGLAERLERELPGGSTSLAQRRVSADGTVKLLLRLADGRAVESVLMPDYRADRAAGCLSSQVGCALGCGFCATGRSGFERDLTAGEMVEQYRALRRQAAALGRRVQTAVFMGMGEPLLNLEAVLAAIRRLTEPSLDVLGCRQIMVSTAGIVPGIHALFDSGLPVKLAVSLHAPDDETRARLLPPARRYPLLDILAAAGRFQARNRRTVTVQYCLLKGVNDSPEHARRLAALLRGRQMHVNLLRYSSTGAPYEASDDAAQERFLAELAARGVVAHARRQRGADIDAACGQLRARP